MVSKAFAISSDVASAISSPKGYSTLSALPLQAQVYRILPILCNRILQVDLPSS